MKYVGTLEMFRKLLREYDRHESLETVIVLETAKLKGITPRQAADLWDVWRDEWELADYFSDTHDHVAGRMENDAMCQEEAGNEGWGYR